MKKTIIFLILLFLVNCKGVESYFEPNAEANSTKISSPVLDSTSAPIPTLLESPATTQPPSLIGFGGQTIDSIQLIEKRLNEVDFPKGVFIFESDKETERYYFDLQTRKLDVYEGAFKFFRNEEINDLMNSNFQLPVFDDQNVYLLQATLREDNQIAKRIFDYENYTVGLVSLSPDEKYFGYILGKGHLEYDHFKFQQILIGNSTGRSEALLALEGGAWGVYWANNSNTIAYSDYDEEGVLQVYLYDFVTAENSQVTRFTGNDFLVREIKWSPSDNYLILEYLYKSKQNKKYLILNLDKNIVEFETEVDNYSGVWWKSETEVLLVKEEGRNIYVLQKNIKITGESKKFSFSVGELDRMSFMKFSEYDNKLISFSYENMIYIDLSSNEIIKLSDVWRPPVWFRDWQFISYP